MEKPYLIGICGGSGSGKTTFLKALRGYFSERDVCIISLDEYYHPRESQHTDEQGIKNFDLPDSIDSKAFVDDLLKLIDGQEVQRKEYVFNNPTAIASTKIYHPARVIVVEGLFIYHYNEISRLLDLKLFIEAKAEYKIIRRIKRDEAERNYPLEDVLYRYQYHVSPAFEKYIQPYKDQAHLIINNNEHFEKGLEVIKAYITDRLGG